MDSDRIGNVFIHARIPILYLVKTCKEKNEVELLVTELLDNGVCAVGKSSKQVESPLCGANPHLSIVKMKYLIIKITRSAPVKLTTNCYEIK